MNQTNQLHGEAQHYKLWFETKKAFENRTKTQVQDCVLNAFNEGKNYRTCEALINTYK